MSASRQCPRCAAPLSADAPEGLCPRCLVRLNFGPEAATAALPSQETRASPRRHDPARLAQLFPQLEIHEPLGRGGMGEVFKARQPMLDRWVALKILTPDKERDPRFAERFTREAQTLARLNHPNIVTIFDFGEVDGLFFLIMEFVDGLSLRELLATDQLTPETALAVIPSICDALQFAHQRGVVHRDIKPENILLDREGRVKIADFGIAKILGAAAPDANLTGETNVVGTPHYMAPEQVEAPRQVDHRADIYSLGVVFYEMLTGELPLGRFEPPSRRVHVDVRLDEIVLRALEKRPERRYQQASAIKSAVEAVAASATAFVRGAEDPAASTTAASSVSDQRARRARLVLLYGGIACVIALPVGLALQLPYVWALSIFGIAIASLKLTGRWPSTRDAAAHGPRAVPHGAPAPVSTAAIVATLAAIAPPVAFLVFLLAGDLDADVRFWVGAIGLPVAVLFGVLAALLIRAFRSTPGTRSTPARPWRFRWNAPAVVAAVIAIPTLPLCGGAVVFLQLIAADANWNPGAREAAVVVTIFGGAVLGLLAMTLCLTLALRGPRAESDRRPPEAREAASPPMGPALSRAALATRWAARVSGSLCAALMIPFILGRGLPPILAQPGNVQFAFAAGTLLLAGFVLGWRREGLAALLIASGWTLLAISEPEFPPLPWIPLIAALHAFSWWTHRGRQSALMATAATALVLILSLGRALSPVNVRVEGTVRDAATGNPIANATLLVHSDQSRTDPPFARSDPEGKFAMRLGWYRPSQPVTIRADGFLPNIRPLGPRGWGNRQVRRDYALQPIPSPRREPRLSAVLPVVIWTEPPSGASDVDPGLRELRVAFSRPPVARAEWSWQPAGSPDQLPRSAGPVETLDGGRVLCIPIAPLRPNTVYAFWVNTPANAPLKDERGAPVVPYLWIFRTRPASTHSEKL